MNRFILFFLLTSALSIAQTQNTVTIGILDEKLTQDSEPLLKQLKKDITDVVGQGTTVILNEVLFNNHDVVTAKENYTTLLKNNTDIIIAFGVVNTIMLYQEKSYAKPTVIVGAINNDFVDIPKNQTKSGINNLTYLITPFSYKDDLDAFATLFQFKKIGIVIDDFMLELLPIQELFDEYFANKESTYEFITLTKENNVDSLFNNVDAVYLVSYMNLNNTALNEVITSINNNKLPSISGYGVKDVEKGILLTNQPEINLDQIFRRIALNVESINSGTNASDLRLHIDYNKRLSVNMSTADLIDFPIRNSMLATINLIEGSIQVESEYSYSLKDLMNGVVERNLSLSADRKNIKLSEQDVKNSKSQYFPDITANVNGIYLDPKVAEIANGQNPEFSTAGNVTLKQVIYSEQATANITIQKYLLDAQKEDFNANQLDALLNTSASYFNALILKTNVGIQNKNLQLTKQNLDIANQNFDLGASGKSDVLRFRSQLAQNTQSMIQARNSLKQAYYQINQLLNNPISNKIEIKDTEITTGLIQNDSYDYLLESLDDPRKRLLLIGFLVEEAKQNAPELKNIEYNINAVVRNYRLNDWGRFIPTAALQAEYNYSFSKSGIGSDTPKGYPVSPDGDYYVGLNISLPLFQQNLRNIARQTSKIQDEQLYIQKDNTELNIEKNINDIVLDLINEVTNIEISAINEGFSKESLELSQNEYKNGAIPVIQLIDAQNNYLKAQLDNATAKYNYFLVSMQLQRAFGYFFLMNTETSNQKFIQRANQYISNIN